MIQRHGEDTQTLHAELMALLLAAEGERGWSHLAGSFVTKSIRGGEYVYFQYSEPGGGRRQFSIGPASPAIDRIVASYRAGRAERAAEDERIERLARLLVAAGVTKVGHGPARVLSALADAGVFRLGGVLVGTWAFSLLGNTLGVQWPAGAWRTEDIDIAGRVEIATPPLEGDVPKALDSLQMGFVPVPPFDSRHPSTSFKVRGKQLRVDLLIAGSDAQREPVFVPRFAAAAAPIKFLSLLLTDPIPAAAIDGGATLVVVPEPARFALHKLLVSQTRSVVQQTKAGKDLHQAALLLEVLHEDRAGDLEAACASFRRSGPAVVKKIARAVQAMRKRWPATAHAAEAVAHALL